MNMCDDNENDDCVAAHRSYVCMTPLGLNCI